MLIAKDGSAYKFVLKDCETCHFFYEATQFATAKTIPKIIHQVWIGPHPAPKKWMKTFQEDYLKENPDWDYILWDETKIKTLKMVNQELYDQETDLPGKVDILRYEILYQFGGVYIDADCRWINHKSLNELLPKVSKKGLFSCREDHRLIGNSVIGSVPGNPIIAFVMNTISDHYHELRITNQWESWIATGPVIFTECIKQLGTTIFPSHLFYPLSWHYDQRAALPEDYPDSFTIHYGYSTNKFYLDEEYFHD
jgi:mannosyltransferase OCH1-like enzyme